MEGEFGRSGFPVVRDILCEASYAAAFDTTLSADGELWYRGNQTTIGSGA